MGKFKDKIKEKIEDGRTWLDVKAWQAREWAKENPQQAATVICTDKYETTVRNPQGIELIWLFSFCSFIFSPRKIHAS